MILTIFLLLLIMFSFAWSGHRGASIICFIISLFLSIFWFWHHATADIGLSL